VPSRPPPSAREEQDSSGASDDLGRVAGRPGVAETTAVGDLAAVPGGSTTSLAILVSALTAAWLPGRHNVTACRHSAGLHGWRGGQ
jgi:hypothetical protein